MYFLKVSKQQENFASLEAVSLNLKRSPQTQTSGSFQSCIQQLRFKSEFTDGAGEPTESGAEPPRTHSSQTNIELNLKLSMCERFVRVMAEPSETSTPSWILQLPCLLLHGLVCPARDSQTCDSESALLD